MSLIMLGGGLSVPDFVLPAANTIASIGIPLQFVNAHPDGECSEFSSHRNSYPGVEWDFMLGVHGGRFPYKAEIIQGPSGMTIGEQLVPSGNELVMTSDTWRLRWNNPSAGSHTIEVRFTDQNLATTSRPWTHVCGTTNWVFIDPVSGNNSNSGLIGSPFADLTAVESLSTKLTYIRGGTVSRSGGFFEMDGTSTMTLLGFPGESPRIGENDTWLVVKADDATIKNMEIFHDVMTGASQDRKIIGQILSNARLNIQDILVTNFEYGAQGANNGAIFASSGAISTDQFIHGLEVTGSTSTIFNTFKHRNALYQKITAHDATFDSGDSSSASGALRLKDGWDNVTIRLCELWDNNTWPGIVSGCIAIVGQDALPHVINKTDVCYNKCEHDSNSNQKGAFVAWGVGISISPDIDDIHIYRNSFQGDPTFDCYVKAPGAADIGAQTDQNNVYENGTENTLPPVTNISNRTGSNVLDASLNIIDQNDLGTHGAQVAS